MNNPHNKHLSYIAIILSGLIVSTGVRALEISADFSMQDNANGVGTWKGGVLLTEGPYRLSAEEVTIEYDESNRPCVVRAIGQPVYADGPIEGESAQVQGQVLIYNCREQQARASGDAVFDDGRGRLVAENIVYNFIQKQIQADGRGESKVKMQFPR